MSRILVCAATPTEAGACEQGIRAAEVSTLFEIFRTGVGPTQAARAIRERLARGPRPAAIVSSGFAGSWSELIDVGAWVTAESIADSRGGLLSCIALSGARPTLLCSVEAIQETPPEDLIRRLQTISTSLSVDMESFALAQEAVQNQIRFGVFRYVTDSPREPLPEFVRHFTNVVTERSPRARLTALTAGTRALVQSPRSVPALLKNGLAWKKALANGWQTQAARIAIDLSRQALG